MATTTNNPLQRFDTQLAELLGEGVVLADDNAKPAEADLTEAQKAADENVTASGAKLLSEQRFALDKNNLRDKIGEADQHRSSNAALREKLQGRFPDGKIAPKPMPAEIVPEPVAELPVPQIEKPELHELNLDSAKPDKIMADLGNDNDGSTQFELKAAPKVPVPEKNLPTADRGVITSADAAILEDNLTVAKETKASLPEATVRPEIPVADTIEPLAVVPPVGAESVKPKAVTTSEVPPVAAIPAIEPTPKVTVPEAKKQPSPSTEITARYDQIRQMPSEAIDTSKLQTGLGQFEAPKAE